MTVVKIMAQTLDRELLARGIRMARADCEAIMTAVIERTAATGASVAAAAQVKDRTQK